ncbi:hypothetical protein [Brevibacillus daliensis]|uniref:hypothetical protein n=1 Tax=Brevibacillus daliensis TaxID=2892995 RepID=UPI001E5B1EB1|nr:hypothetical protein [Brevibacillus daliensis]
MNKGLKRVVKTNLEVIQFMEWLRDNHSFTGRERDGIFITIRHLETLQKAFDVQSKPRMIN